MLEIAIGKNQVIWAKKQTVKGTPVWPSAADAIEITGDGKFDQDRSFYKDKRKKLTKRETGRVGGLYPAGTFSFPCYIMPSGSPGVVPSPAPVLESLMGKQTITADTYVDYDLYALEENPVYLTVLVKNNFMTVLVSDLVVSKGSIPIVAANSDEGIVEGSFSGNFLKSLIAGTDATSALAAAAATSIVVVDARKFEVGQKIIVGTSGVTSGHLITAVAIATNTLTIAASGLETEQASGVVVKGWTPAVTTSGYMMFGRFGKFQEKEGEGEYADLAITQATLEIDGGWKAIDDEKNDSYYGSAFAPADGVITCKIARYVRSDGAKYRYEANNQIVKLIKLQAAAGPWSLSAGKRMEASMLNMQIDPPAESGDAERKYDITAHIYDTAALNDALKLRFS
jgi:hypothetical protein